MKRRRHLLMAALAGLPLLVLVLFWASGRGAGAISLGVALWVLTVAVLEGLTWRTVAAPVREMMRDLEVENAHQAQRALRTLRDTALACETERSRTSELLEDLTSSLGDGLLVVSSELEIRLINRVARRFCGVEGVTLGTHLLEILRNPDAVRAVEAAAVGNDPDPVVTFHKNNKSILKRKISTIDDMT